MCVILDNGALKCWGNGFGGNQSNSSPIALGSGRTAKQVALGRSHVCAILDNDTLKCWGENRYGQLGDGTNTRKGKPPTTVLNLGAGRSAKQIFAGENHTCVLLDNNTIKCWGLNSGGQLGNGTKVNANQPGTAINLGTGRTAKQVVAGLGYSCALLDDGSIKCWGDNTYGILADGTRFTVALVPSATPIDLRTSLTAKRVITGSSHVCFVK